MANLVNGGWIKLYRDLISKSIWQLSSPEHKTVLITILLLANHEETKWEWKGQQFCCKPGQLITSLESLATESGAGVSIRNVRTALQRFEKLGFLTNESTKTGRLITVVNWGKYQGQTSEGDKEPDKDLTKSRQRPDKDLTTNKNDKNNKNDKKDKNIHRASALFVSPSLEEITSYCMERNSTVDPEEFYDYYTARGWKLSKGAQMKDWKAAVRSWEKRSKPSDKYDNHPDQRKHYGELDKEIFGDEWS